MLTWNWFANVTPQEDAFGAWSPDALLAPSIRGFSDYDTAFSDAGGTILRRRS